jgi:hypothetical protein
MIINEIYFIYRSIQTGKLKSCKTVIKDIDLKRELNLSGNFRRLPDKKRVSTQLKSFLVEYMISIKKDWNRFRFVVPVWYFLCIGIETKRTISFI